jgi:putative SOS response-associated peptidase YedK
MCGRFSVISNSKTVNEHFNLVRSEEFIHSYNVSPSNNIPVVRLDADDRVLVNMHWGLIPHWAKDTKIKPINAKAESIDKKTILPVRFQENPLPDPGQWILRMETCQ